MVPSRRTFTWWTFMTVIHQIWWTSIIHIWLASRIQYMHTSYMMDIHLIHKWWTFIIFINDGHPSYSLMMDIHNLWHLSYMTNTLLTGPSLSSKPLQEHKLIIIMELHHYWLSNTLLFIFQIKYTLVKSILLMPKWNFWNPVAKFDIDPKKAKILTKINKDQVGYLSNFATGFQKFHFGMRSIDFTSVYFIWNMKSKVLDSQ